MAIRGHSCGWELHQIPGNTASGSEQDIWNVTGWNIATPHITRAHGGRYSCLLDYGTNFTRVTGHAEPFSGSATKKWWSIPHSPVSIGGTPEAVGAAYILQLTDNSVSDGKWLAITASMFVNGNNTFKYSIHLVEKVDGTATLTELCTWENEVDPTAVGNSDWYLVQCEWSDAGDHGTVKLYVGLNGDATERDSQLLTEAQATDLQLDAYALPNAVFATDKGTGAVVAYFDDLITCDDQDGGLDTRPTFSEVVKLVPPVGDTAERDWTGVFRDGFNQWKNWQPTPVTQTPRLTDYNDPTGTTNHRQVSDIAEIESGTVVGMRVIWTQTAASKHATEHDVRAGLSGTYATYADCGGGSQNIGGVGIFHGREFTATPEGTPAAWTRAKFNELEAGLEAKVDTDNVACLCVMAVGSNMVQKTYRRLVNVT